MKSIFAEFSKLSNIHDMSKWNTNKVTDMSFMFYGGSNLLDIPDISKWSTNKVTNMGCMFSECWKLSNTKMEYK